MRATGAEVESIAYSFNSQDGPGLLAAAQEMAKRMVRESEAIPESYWHPLGFFRLEYGADDNGWRYAVHCWPAGYRSTQKPSWLIHRHVWPLESFVAVGGLIDRQYLAVDGPADLSGTKYEVEVSQGQSELIRTVEDLNVARLRDSMHERRFYSVDSMLYHESHVPLGDECITLVRIGPRVKRASDVLGDLHGPERLRYERHPVELAARRAVLQALAAVG
jgi:hypothetical protein